MKLISLGLRIVVGLVVLLIGFGLIGFMVSTREKPQLKPGVFAPLFVEGLVLEPQPLARSWSGYGTANAMNSARVSPQVSGRVLERSAEVEAGFVVTKGQPLFVLDAIDFELAASNARSSMTSIQAQLDGLDIEEDRVTRQVELAREEQAIAERDLARASDVIGRGAGNDSEIDQWTSAVRRAQRAVVALEQQLDSIPSRRDDLQARKNATQSQLRQAEENILRSTVNAPIDGVLQSVSLEVGEWAQTGQEGAVIVDLSKIEIPLRVGVGASGLIAVGDRAEIRMRAEDSVSWTGRVSRIAPQMNAQTRAMTVYVEVEQDPSAARVLRPGQFVIGTIYESTTQQQLIVPRRTLDAGRVLIAIDSGGDVAAVWPLAERIAGTIARSISIDTNLQVGTGAADLGAVVQRSAEIEVGVNAVALAEVLTVPASGWYAGDGQVRVGETIQRELTQTLTPAVARWLIETDAASLPQSLQDELAITQRLLVVESVEVESLFTVEQVFADLDPVESQWVVVRARDGRDLAHQVLLTTNLEQLSDGMMVEVEVRGGEAP